MRVQERIRVPEDLQIDPTESGVQAPTGSLHRFTEPVHVGQERQPLGPGQFGQPLNAGLVHEENRVSRQELHVADHREP